jgi:hypothetical protein
MSDSISVEITVRSHGDGHHARAGSGKQAKTASCTSDALSAALRAAAKWLLLPVERIVIERTTESTFIARPIGANEVFTEIDFEDKGQDFLHWVIAGDGIVFDCTPFQSWVWCGGRVTNLKGLRVGGFVEFSSYQEKIIITERVEKLNRRAAS